MANRPAGRIAARIGNPGPQHIEPAIGDAKGYSGDFRQWSAIGRGTHGDEQLCVVIGQRRPRQAAPGLRSLKGGEDQFCKAGVDA